MEPPPVRYVRTQDGFDIAYTAVGEGVPFVFTPWPVLGLALWRAEDARPFLEHLSERFHLVHYDARGQGLSTRGLPESHVVEHYMLDLQAVVDAAGLERFVLFGNHIGAHAAVRYTVEHPERVAALILNHTSLESGGEGALALDAIAQRDWELFLHTLSSTFWIDRDRERALALDRESLNQADYLAMVRAARQSSIEALLPQIKVPTLVIAAQRMAPGAGPAQGAADARTIASLVPNSRLQLFDVYGSYYISHGGEPPAIVSAIEGFLAEAGVRRASPDVLLEPAAAGSARITGREAEVLRLIAQGRSNQQIADELVLSVRTVERHITNLYAKIGAHGKADATAYALRNGLG